MTSSSSSPRGSFWPAPVSVMGEAPPVTSSADPQDADPTIGEPGSASPRVQRAGRCGRHAYLPPPGGVRAILAPTPVQRRHFLEVRRRSRRSRGIGRATRHMKSHVEGMCEAFDAAVAQRGQGRLKIDKRLVAIERR